MEKSARPRTALNESVKVVVRCRPLAEKEKLEGYEEVRRIRPPQPWYERLSATKPVYDDITWEAPVEVVKVWPERGAVQVLNPRGQDKMFTYDAAYDASADTRSIYDEMVRPLVASVLDGFNGCVFAYGQTGTGKTHTMEGAGDDEGIIPRTFNHIWTHIENTASPDVTHLVSCSYVELYMEDVRDLLAKDGKKLTIRGQQELNGFYIPEMTSVECKSAAEMVRVMKTGRRQRAAGRTDMNEHSSRSHAVFMVTVETAHRDTDTIRVGKLNLVDLAGSERQRKTGAGGERLKEAARINQALSSLGNVISALAENSPHVPYRDSKLTRILQDSLGGNSKTIMIANVGPAAYNYDETVTTLRYAHRAKAIKNKPVRNEDPKDAKLREYQAEIERLRSLIAQRGGQERGERGDKGERKKKEDKRSGRMPRESGENKDDTVDAVTIEREKEMAASSVAEELCRTSELERQVQLLEQRLVQGGGGKELINNLNHTQVILEQRNMEILERKKREIEMQQRIELEEETTASVTRTFATLQQEVDHKTLRIKKIMSKYMWTREECAEQREAHEAERRELEAAVCALVGALRRRSLLASSFVPPSAQQGPTSRSPLRSRPCAHPGQRRYLALEALSSQEASLRCDNVLQLMPLALPSTARAYRHRTPEQKPPPPAAQSKAKKEPDLAPPRKATARSRPTTSLVRLGTAGGR